MRCEYFVLCDREADGWIDNPVIGEVPACQRCADRVGLELTGSYRLRRARQRARIVREANRKEQAYRAGRLAEKRAVVEGR